MESTGNSKIVSSLDAIIILALPLLIMIGQEFAFASESGKSSDLRQAYEQYQAFCKARGKILPATPPVNTSDRDIRQEYVKNKTTAYKDILNEMKERGEPSLVCDQYIRHQVLLEVPKDEFDWVNHPEKPLNMAAICFAAADFESTVPLDLLGGYFDFSTIGPESSYFTRLVPLGKDRATTLSDYPLMYLADACGKKSTPFLQKIVESPAISEDVRLKAFAMLCSIDAAECGRIVSVFSSTLSEEGRSWLQEFIEDPLVDPWMVPVIYTKEYKITTERAQRSTDSMKERHRESIRRQIDKR